MMLQLPEERRERITQKEQKEIEKQQNLKEQASKKGQAKTQNKLKRNKTSGLSTTPRRLLELQAFVVSVTLDREIENTR